jgi:hypothetical protein
MRPGELLEVAARAADHAEHLAVERQLEDAARIRQFAEEDHVALAGRDAQRIGRADHAGEAITGRGIAGWTGPLRNVDAWYDAFGVKPGADCISGRRSASGSGEIRRRACEEFGSSTCRSKPFYRQGGEG